MFDECHKAKNFAPGKEASSTKAGCSNPPAAPPAVRPALTDTRCAAPRVDRRHQLTTRRHTGMPHVVPHGDAPCRVQGCTPLPTAALGASQRRRLPSPLPPPPLPAGAFQVATCVIELQQRLPRARVLYCSATGVSEVGNMAYMNRMGCVPHQGLACA